MTLPTSPSGARTIGTDSAVLVLEDGTRHIGRAYGARGTTLGEVVFATGMSGYQETLTDPSYAGQIVLQTAPPVSYTHLDVYKRQLAIRPTNSGSMFEADGGAFFRAD